jgi:hypothetical protein
MGPVSPDCGSKRKCPGLDLVVDQIGHLPAMLSGSHSLLHTSGPQHTGPQAQGGQLGQGRAIKHAKRRRLADAHMACGGEGGHLSDGSCTPTRSGSQCESLCPGMSEVMTRTVGEALGLS